MIASVLPEKNWTIFLLTVTLVDEISDFAMLEVYSCFLDFISSLIRPRRQIKNYWASCCKFPSKKGQYLSNIFLKLRVLTVSCTLLLALL